MIHLDPIYSFSFSIMSTCILSKVMNEVKDEKLETQLSVEEMQVRADALLKRMGITAKHIHMAKVYSRKESDSKFIRIFMQ